MRLSEKLQRDHECGDFGQALKGYAEQAASLESSVDELTRKGEDLCQAYGAALFKIHDLEAKHPEWMKRIQRERREAVALAVDAINTQIQEHGFGIQFDPSAFV